MVDVSLGSTYALPHGLSVSSAWPLPHSRVEARSRSSNRKCSVKKLFLEIPQYSQDNNYVGVSF